MGFSDIFGGGSTSAPSTVWGGQAPFLQDLYGRSQMASYGDQGTGYAQQVAGQAQQGLGQMLGGGFQTPGLQQGLQGFGGMQNQALGGAIESGLGQISRNFQQNIMPGINTGAAMTGTAGGSRQGIAQGLAAQGANQQASDFVNRMQSQNWAQQMQNQLGAYGQMAGLQGQQNQMLAGGMGMAPQTQNLGFGAQYGNLQALQGLYGSPTVLGGGGTSAGGIFAPIQL
jgi:hypothetical protein